MSESHPASESVIGSKTGPALVLGIAAASMMRDVSEDGFSIVIGCVFEQTNDRYCGSDAALSLKRSCSKRRLKFPRVGGESEVFVSFGAAQSARLSEFSLVKSPSLNRPSLAGLFPCLPLPGGS